MFDPDDLVTKDTWIEYSETDNSLGYVTYMKATEDILPVIKKMITTSQSFDDLKNELTKFYTERSEFVKYARQNLP